MELKWLEDLIALAEAETLTLAAEQRNVTQPAFSRRVQAIEDWLGVPVLDRSHKPARVTPAVTRHLDEVRALAHDLRRLRNEMQAWENSHRRLVLAAPHALSVTYVPRLIAHLQALLPGTTIRLRSANLNECMALLLTRQALVLVAYEAPHLVHAADDTLMERICMGADALIPVAAPTMAKALLSAHAATEPIDVIAYPSDVFLGTVLAHEILPRLLDGRRVTVRCESALVPAVVQLALVGVGLAWLPRSVAAPHIARGELVKLTPVFDEAPLLIHAARLRTAQSSFADKVWTELKAYAHTHNRAHG